jgi:hypothetical protein
VRADCAVDGAGGSLAEFADDFVTVDLHAAIIGEA